jgi:hypothetical protein
LLKWSLPVPRLRAITESETRERETEPRAIDTRARRGGIRN